MSKHYAARRHSPELQSQKLMRKAGGHAEGSRLQHGLRPLKLNMTEVSVYASLAKLVREECAKARGASRVSLDGLVRRRAPATILTRSTWTSRSPTGFASLPPRQLQHRGEKTSGGKSSADAHARRFRLRAHVRAHVFSRWPRPCVCARLLSVAPSMCVRVCAQRIPRALEAVLARTFAVDV
eukprot:6191254-Pleurochrysis_carterae.AAC.1